MNDKTARSLIGLVGDVTDTVEVAEIVKKAARTRLIELEGASDR